MPGGGGTLVSIEAGFIDRSGIAYDMDKHNAMPPGWFEVEGYRESGSFNDASATRVFEGPWSQRLALRAWALGACWMDADGKTLHRDIPAQHPELPWLYATDCELVSGQGVFVVNPNVVPPGSDFGDPDNPPAPLGMIQYRDGSGLIGDSLSCSMSITYHVMDFDILSDAQMAGPTSALSNNGFVSQPSDFALSEVDRYVVKTSVDSLQGQAFGSNQLLFQTGPNAGSPIAAVASTKLFPCEELNYVWKNVPKVPQANIDICMGGVNTGTFDPNSRLRPGGYADGTILCMAPQKIPKRTSQGLWVFDMVYKFLYKPTGWNNFMDQKGNFYPTAFGYPGTVTLYPSVDLSLLFKLG